MVDSGSRPLLYGAALLPLAESFADLHEQGEGGGGGGRDRRRKRRMRSE